MLVIITGMDIRIIGGQAAMIFFNTIEIVIGFILLYFFIVEIRNRQHPDSDFCNRNSPTYALFRL